MLRAPQRDAAVGNRGKLLYTRFPLETRNRALMVGTLVNKITGSVPEFQLTTSSRDEYRFFAATPSQVLNPCCAPGGFSINILCVGYYCAFFSSDNCF